MEIRKFDILYTMCYSASGDQCTDLKTKQKPYKSCARDKPDDRTATSRRERCQSLYDRIIPVPRLVFLRLFFREQGEMRCIFIHGEYYEVHTHWGWFRLDEGAYRDYLAGKLWITWHPGEHPSPQADGPTTPCMPPNVSEEAVRLRDTAAKREIYSFLQECYPGIQVTIPFKARMKDTPIEEMSLTVRSSNGLMRAGAGTFGKLWDLMSRENGLRGVRNLGLKSEQEITRCFFSACYAMLAPGEQALFWQTILNRNQDEPV